MLVAGRCGIDLARVMDHRRPADFMTALLEVLAYDGAGVATVAVIVGAMILFVLWWAA